MPHSQICHGHQCGKSGPWKKISADTGMYLLICNGIPCRSDILMGTGIDISRVKNGQNIEEYWLIHRKYRSNPLYRPIPTKAHILLRSFSVRGSEQIQNKGEKIKAENSEVARKKEDREGDWGERSLKHTWTGSSCSMLSASSSIAVGHV